MAEVDEHAFAARHPYGRSPTVAYVVVTVGVTAMALNAYATNGFVPVRGLLAAAVLLSAFVGFVAFLTFVPDPLAVRVGGDCLARVPAWRRTGLGSCLALPLLGAAAGFANGGERLIGGAIACSAGIAMALLHSQAFAFDSTGLRMAGALRRRDAVRWADLSVVEVYAGGLVLRPRSGRPVRIAFCRTLNGYPELVAQLVASAPASALPAASTADGARLEALTALARSSKGVPAPRA